MYISLCATLPEGRTLPFEQLDVAIIFGGDCSGLRATAVFSFTTSGAEEILS